LAGLEQDEGMVENVRKVIRKLRDAGKVKLEEGRMGKDMRLRDVLMLVLVFSGLVVAKKKDINDYQTTYTVVSSSKDSSGWCFATLRSGSTLYRVSSVSGNRYSCTFFDRDAEVRGRYVPAKASWVNALGAPVDSDYIEVVIGERNGKLRTELLGVLGQAK
jgi:hypothetical protein